METKNNELPKKTTPKPKKVKEQVVKEEVKVETPEVKLEKIKLKKETVIPPHPLAIPPIAVSRPWQGILLGIINILVVVLMLAAVVFNILDYADVFDLGSYFGGTFGLWGMMSFFTSPLASLIQTIILAGLVIFLETYLIKGVFKGTRWVLYAMIGLTLLLLANRYYLMFSPVLVKLTYFAIIVFLLYLEIVCLMHPFYKQNLNKIDEIKT